MHTLSRVYNVHATVIRPTREYHTYYLFIYRGHVLCIVCIQYE